MSIAIAALAQLAELGEVKSKVVKEAIEKYQINDVKAADPGNTEGAG